MSSKQTQKGFTLIELMIVVAIIGILAAIAIPAYQDYINRSKVTEAVTAAAACKTSVMEYAASNGALPADASAAGCGSTPTKYVASLSVANGVISVVLQSVNSAVDGKKLVLSPTKDVTLKTAAANGDTIVGWHCGTDAAPTDFKFFPANCRQAALAGP